MRSGRSCIGLSGGWNSTTDTSHWLTSPALTAKALVESAEDASASKEESRAANCSSFGTGGGTDAGCINASTNPAIKAPNTRSFTTAETWAPQVRDLLARGAFRTSVGCVNPEGGCTVSAPRSKRLPQL